MFIELVDTLRCPRPHEESWLVATADRMEARHVLEGTLGCPVCRAEFPVRAGIVDLALGSPLRPPAPAGRDSERAMRLAAFLGLDDGQGFAVLLGAWGTDASSLRELVDCPLLLVDPPADVVAEPGLSIIRTSGAVPLAAGAARGVAIDAGDQRALQAARARSAVQVARVAGRVVGPASMPLPEGVRELARDGEVWVAEREPAPSSLVTLHVRRGGGVPPASPGPPMHGNRDG
jgi:uncharacterized protein YbaR (Trm112 family)